MLSAGDRTSQDPTNEWVALSGGNDGFVFDSTQSSVLIGALGKGDERSWYQGELRCLTVFGGTDANFGIKDSPWMFSTE